MKVIGLTGSIAMGKSYVANAFRSLGVPVFDSDREVFRLYSEDPEINRSIATRFPWAVGETGIIDRAKLGRRIFKDKSAKIDLEAILHPPVFGAQRRFLKRAQQVGYRTVILDIPLLFETAAQRRLDATIVVETNELIQRQRALRRIAMDAAKLKTIQRSQMPNFEKHRRADFRICSGIDRGQITARVISILHAIDGKPAVAWPASWLRASPKGG